MKPEVLAFVLLVIVSAIGAYIIYSPKAGLPEGFDAASRAAALQCEKSYNECLRDGSTIETCTKQSSVCLSAITNPSVSQVANAPSGIPRKTQADCERESLTCTASQPICAERKLACLAQVQSVEEKRTYDSLGNPTGTTGKVILGNPSENQVSVTYGDLAAAANSGKQILSSEWSSFLKQVQGNLGGSAVKPTAQQLDLVQGAGIAPVVASTPSYTPSQTVIKPHEQVPKMLPTMTALLDTDKNTQAQQIAMNTIYTPSIRQMIRDDVKDVVREEIEANQINNPYAVNYESY